MSNATTPTLGGTTLPSPTTYRETVRNRGGYREMANGAVVVDLVVAPAKRNFQLSWRNVSNTDKATILTAWATIDDSTATFRPPTYNQLSVDYTVGRDPSRPELDIEAVNTPNALLWNIEMSLREN